jgi:anti-anti-sigma factor
MRAQSDPSVKRIELVGEYDLSRKDEVARLFGSINGEPSVVIDMAKVSYIDSTFLNELGALRLRDESRSIRLSRPNEHVRRILKIVNFDEVFDIAE